jgi:hypothetical protein
VFHQHSWIGIRGTKKAYLHIEELKLQEAFLQQLIEFSKGINELESAASHIDSFFGEIHVFLQLSWIGLFGAKRADLHPEKCKIQQVFLSKVTHILQGNKVLDAAASNTNGFLQDLHLFLHISWIGLFGTKWAFLHLENYDLQELFLSKTIS